ncbi:MAG TPA: anaerobic ribonucleoside-triphosphate reductase [Casimicrobiaceae bacterium]|nr:anaerobic ribonucleoside-triphosphate reductase [Casimicrobiaceae bacterium]
MDTMAAISDLAESARHEPAPTGNAVLPAAERQRCEVWTRVMGYHRPVASFNIGKKGEHAERRFFTEAQARLGDAAA